MFDKVVKTRGVKKEQGVISYSNGARYFKEWVLTFSKFV